jgi:hypothetical protein
MEYVTNPEMNPIKRLYSNLKDSIGYFGFSSGLQTCAFRIETFRVGTHQQVSSSVKVEAGLGRHLLNLGLKEPVSGSLWHRPKMDVPVGSCRNLVNGWRGMVDKKRRYWCRCFIAAAQRMMKKPIQSAARWNGMTS